MSLKQKVKKLSYPSDSSPSRLPETVINEQHVTKEAGPPLRLSQGIDDFVDRPDEDVFWYSILSGVLPQNL